MSYPQNAPHVTPPVRLSSFRGLLILLAVFIAGFAGGYGFFEKFRAEPKAQPQAQATVLPAKKTTAYVIRSSDRLAVSVENHGDLRTTARVDSKGAINLPVVLGVRVQGLTVPEAEAAIRGAYLKRLAIGDSRVTITIDEWAPREVTIGGQVRKPGRYSLQVDSTKTLRDLLFTAGGGTDTAKLQAVRVTRILRDGSIKTEIYDADPAHHGRSSQVKDDSFVLEPDDIVYVPERII